MFPLNLIFYFIHLFLHTMHRDLLWRSSDMCDGRLPKFRSGWNSGRPLLPVFATTRPCLSSHLFLLWGLQLYCQTCRTHWTHDTDEMSDADWSLNTYTVREWLKQEVFVFVFRDVSAEIETWNGRDPSKLKGWFMTAVLALRLFLV